TPKGWTGPGEGTFHAHQVPLTNAREDPSELDRWMRSYQPEELFDDGGAPIEVITGLAPAGQRRMSANPHTNGGLLRRDLILPATEVYAAKVPAPGATQSEATRHVGQWLRDIIVTNPDRFRLFGPDEVASNRLGHVFEATDRVFTAEIEPRDE